MGKMQVMIDTTNADILVDGVSVDNAWVVSVIYPDATPKEPLITLRLKPPSEICQLKALRKTHEQRKENDMIGNVKRQQELVDSGFDLKRYDCSSVNKENKDL